MYFSCADDIQASLSLYMLCVMILALALEKNWMYISRTQDKLDIIIGRWASKIREKKP